MFLIVNEIKKVYSLISLILSLYDFLWVCNFKIKIKVTKPLESFPGPYPSDRFILKSTTVHTSWPTGPVSTEECATKRSALSLSVLVTLIVIHSLFVRHRLRRARFIERLDPYWFCTLCSSLNGLMYTSLKATMSSTENVKVMYIQIYYNLH